MIGSGNDSFRDWYGRRRAVYEGVAAVADQILGRLIAAAGIAVVSVSARAKTIDSAAEKVLRKGYLHPKDEMTDLAGVRIITFVESDVPCIAALVERAFTVVHEKSSDKTTDLGVDRSGYRSVHYVCSLGEARTNLPEFEPYTSIAFEVQIRTALQHAWAEIEHDRRYKFSGVLPTLLQRRLYLLAGMLEIADREFSSIAADVDAYAESVTRATVAGELDVELNSTSVASFLNERTKSLKKARVSTKESEPVPSIVIEEMLAFGLKSLDDLSTILSDEFLAAVDRYPTRRNTPLGLLREAMMWQDLDRYFAKAWGNHWQGTDEQSLKLLRAKYGNGRIANLVSEHELKIFDL